MTTQMATVNPGVKTVAARPFHRLDDGDENPQVAVKETKANLELMRQNQEQTENKDLENLSPEEATWKKRYGDLRSYQTKQAQAFKGQINELQAQIDKLKVSPKVETALPKTAEELMAWKKQYPESFDIVKTMILGSGMADSSELDALRAEIKELQTKLSISDEAKALADLRAEVQDFDELQHDKNFHNWVQQKPKREKIIYESQDVDAIVDLINAYRAETGNIKAKKTEKPKDNRKDAALAVTGPKAVEPNPGGEGRIWRESEIARLSRKEFEQFEEDIDLARRTPGRFIQDMPKGR